MNEVFVKKVLKDFLYKNWDEGKKEDRISIVKGVARGIEETAIRVIENDDGGYEFDSPLDVFEFTVKLLKEKEGLFKE